MRKYLVLLLLVLASNRVIYSQCAGKALQFDGVNDYVLNNGFTTSISNNFTIEFWAKPTGTISLPAETTSGFSALSGQRFAIFPHHGGVTDAGAGVSVGTNGVVVVEHAENYIPSLLVHSISITDWTHIAVVYINKQPNLYINGVLVKTGLTSVRAAVHPGFSLGENGSNYGWYLGFLDEVRIWDASLSATTLLQWKNNSVAASHPSYANLKGYWKLDEGMGTTTADASGNGNNGTLYNGPVWVNSGAAIGPVPVINSFSPLFGPAGTAVTVSGSNFDPTPSNNTVYIGNVKVTVTSASSTSLTFGVPAGITNKPITVTNACGLTALSKYSFSPTFTCTNNINSASLSSAQVFSTTQQYTYSITSGDLDGDGKPEMITVGHYGAINIYRNTSMPGSINASSFAAPITIMGGSLAGVKLGDIDGDGKQDIVATGNGTGSVLIYRNTSSPGSLSFATAVSISTGTNGKDAALTDIDLDGKLDLACVPNYYGSPAGNVTLVKNNSAPGSISFGSAVSLAAPPMSNHLYFSRIEAGDLDGDGFSELVISVYNNASVYVYKNNGVQGNITASSYAPYTTITTGNFTMVSAISDLDNDGKPELIAGGYLGISILKNTSTPGSLSFAPKIDFAAGHVVNDIQVGDMNGDGKPDISFFSTGSVLLMQNNSSTGVINNSSFATPVGGFNLVYGGGTSYTGMQNIAISDVDSDGQPDILVTGYNMSSTNSFISAFRNKVGSPAQQTITATGTTAFCVSGSVTFSVPNVAGVSYQWKLDGANIGTNSNSLFATQAGTYSVEMTNACSTTTASNTKTITIDNTVPNAQTINASGPTTFCAPGSVALSVPSQSQVFYQWRRNGVNISSATSTSYTANNTGNYAVNMTNACGATLSSTVPVTLNTVNISSISPSFGNAGTSVTITGNNFDPAPANNIVYFGPVKAIVTSASLTSLTVTSPVGATNSPVSVTIPCGITALSAQSFNPTFNCPGVITNAALDTKVDFTTGTGPKRIAVGDIDGDGKTDMVSLNGTANTVTVFKNVSTPGAINNSAFVSVNTLSLITNPISLLLVDVDGDGKKEIVTGSDNYVSVYRNTSTPGSFSFASRSDFYVGYTAIAIAMKDIDGDNKQDLIILSTYYGSNTYLRVFLNKSNLGSVSFVYSNSTYWAINGAYDLTLDDFNNDGKTDIAFIISGPSSGTMIVVFNGSTVGSFAINQILSYPVAGAQPGIASGDIDNDGKQDIAVLFNNSIRVFRNLGSLSFSSFDYATGNSPKAIILGDFDSDKRLDIATSNSGASTISLLRNTHVSGVLSAGSFAAPIEFTTGTNPLHLSIADFDGDGKQDASVVNQGSNSISVLRNILSASYTNLPPVTLVNSSANCDDGTWKRFYDPANPNRIIASVKDNGNNLGTINTSVYVDASPVTYGSEKFMARHYVIKPQTQPASSVKIRLYFTDAEFNALKAADNSLVTVNDLGIKKYEGPTEDGTYNPTDATSLIFIPPSSITYSVENGYNVAELDVTGFSEFWFTGCQPVSFTSIPSAISANTSSGSCGTVVNFAATGNGTISYSTQPGSTFPVGITNVQVTLSNACSQLTHSFQVTVTDNVPPVPNLASLPTVTGQCSATVTAPTATDNCAGTITATTTDPTSYSAQGTYTINWTYDDGNGNTSTQTQTVVVNDITAPVPDVVSLPTVTGQCSATVTAPTATDNCAGTITATTTDPTSYSAQGTYTINWTYDDGNGNTATQSQTVIINDNTPPSFNACPGNITLSACTGTATWTEPTASDNCPGVTVTRSGPAPGSAFSLESSTTIIYTATDAAGNTASCSFTVSRLSALSAIASATAITCNGGTSSVTVSATGGRAPYSGTGIFSRTAGTYSFTVTDADGCTTTATVTINQPAALAASCTSNNNVLYYGYSGDQTALITVKPSGGVGPYTVSFTMNRPLRCNVITSSGDELWVPGANTASNSNTICPTSGSAALSPVSTSSSVINSTTGYSLTVTLMQGAVITATITDANGCTTTCSISIYAEDVRCFSGNSGVSKVTLCHQTGSSNKPCVKICVDESAISDHLAHGDFFGNCTPNCVAPVTNGGRNAITAMQQELDLPGTMDARIWPNPTESRFILLVQSTSPEPISVRVYDITGKLVYQGLGINSSGTYFGENLVAGIYLAEIKQGSQKVIKKIIKQ